MIPKLSHPLAKSVRTAEFWLVAVADVILAVLPIVQGGLSPHLAAELGTGLTAVYAASRSVVKGVSALGQVTGTGLSPAQEAQAAKLAADVSTVAEAVAPKPPDPLDVGPSAADLAPPPTAASAVATAPAAAPVAPVAPAPGA